jgi:hypothetical protein
LKLSPNLRREPKDDKNNVIGILNRSKYEHYKIGMILSQEFDSDEPVAETTRKLKAKINEFNQNENKNKLVNLDE